MTTKRIFMHFTWIQRINLERIDYFLVDSFPRRYQLDLNSRHRVEQKGSILKYYYPYFGEDVVNGNVMVEVDIERFANEMFNLYPVGKDGNLAMDSGCRRKHYS